MAVYRRFKKQSRVEEFDVIIKNLIMDHDLQSPPPPPSPPLPPPPPAPTPVGEEVDDIDLPSPMDDLPSPIDNLPAPAVESSSLDGDIADIAAIEFDFEGPVSTSEVNEEAEEGGGVSEDEFDFTDADAAIDAMLDDLQDFQLTLGPDSLKEKRDEFGMLSPTREKHEPIEITQFDHLRFNMESFDETPEVDLDALLQDLCSMEQDLKDSEPSERPISADSAFQSLSNLEEHNNNMSRKVVSPAMVTQDVKDRLENLQNELEAKELSPEEQEAKIKSEKMRIALEKMKAASFQKLFIKVFDDDLKTSKTMMIDQTWTARDVKGKMIVKDDVEPDPNWCILEKIPEMYMERILEDHEYVLQTVLDWTRETENMLVFLNRRDKNVMFRNPQNFLLDEFSSSEATKLAEKSKDILLNEFFQKENTRIPPVEGVLWLREGTKKWTKHFFALRASGIYYTPKGKQKSRDLSCLCQLEHNNAYLGVSFKKNFKSPTDYVFCLKHPKIQTMKSKHIICLCAEDNRTLYQWITGVRMAKYGYSLYDDYLKTQEELEALLLAGSRSTLSSGVASSISSSLNEAKSESSLVSDVPATISRKKKGKSNPEDANRMKGKQDKLKDLFATAWSKGIEESESFISDQGGLFSPLSPDPSQLMSPKEDALVFDYSNRAMTVSNRKDIPMSNSRTAFSSNTVKSVSEVTPSSSTNSSSNTLSPPPPPLNTSAEGNTSNTSSLPTPPPPSSDLDESSSSLPPPPSLGNTPNTSLSPTSFLTSPPPPPPPPPILDATPMAPTPPPLNVKPTVPPPPPPLNAKPMPPPPPPLDTKPMPPPPQDMFDLPPPPPAIDDKPARRKSSPPPPPRRSSSISERTLLND